MDERTLSYSELEHRIRELPDGPAAILDPPRWQLIPTIIGTIGMVLGLLPSFLILFVKPQMWMVYVAKAGVWMAFIGVAPVFLWTVYTVGGSMLRWRTEQTAQLDHDLDQMRTLHRWLRGFPLDNLAEHLRFVQMVQARLTIKVGFLAGSLDKLGVLPLLVALAIQIKVYADWDSIPLWQILLGMFAAVTYLVAFVANLMRMRLQLYEAVLSEAMQGKAE